MRKTIAYLRVSTADQDLEKNKADIGVWGVTEQEMHLSPLPAIISTIFPRFNLNMAMPRICLATNII